VFGANVANAVRLSKLKKSLDGAKLGLGPVGLLR
jgi:hypothetical protein